MVEVHMRDMVTEMVKPIVLLAKKNLMHNALKNAKIQELKDQQLECNTVCNDLNRDIQSLIILKEEMSLVQKEFQMQQVHHKT